VEADDALVVLEPVVGACVIVVPVPGVVVWLLVVPVAAAGAVPLAPAA
jgi:hypothetical protein